MGKPGSKRTRPIFTKQIRRKKTAYQELNQKKGFTKRDLTQDKNLSDSKVSSMDSQSNHSEEEQSPTLVSSSLPVSQVEKKTQKHQQTKTTLQSDRPQIIDLVHQIKPNDPVMQIQEVAKFQQQKPTIPQKKNQTQHIRTQLHPNTTNFFTSIQSQKIEDKIKAIKSVMIALESKNHQDAIEIIMDNRFMMELIDMSRKTIAIDLRLEILKIIGLVFSKLDSSCIKWIHKQTIDFLVQMLDEQKDIFIASAEILEGLALKSVSYRDLIIKRKVIFKLLEPSSDPEIINTKVSTLSSLCCGQPYVKRVFTEPIVKYLFRHIKTKTLPKRQLLKALKGIETFFKSINYDSVLLLQSNNIDAIFLLIEQEIASKALPFQKSEMYEENEQTAPKQKLSSTILATCLSIIKVLTAGNSFFSEYTERLQLLQKNKITQIIETLINHDSYQVRLRAVEMVHGLINFYSMAQQQKILQNKYLMKRLIELFQSETAQTQSQICDIYARLSIYAEEQTYILEFYIEYDIVDLLVNTTKGCKSNDLIVKILNTLKIMLEYADQLSQMPAKYEHFFKDSAYYNPLVNILMMVPGVQTILDELYDHENQSVRKVAQQLKMRFIPSPEQHLDHF